MLVEGNISKDSVLHQADKLIKSFENVFNTKWNSEHKSDIHKVVSLPLNKTWITEKVLTVPDEKNCVLATTFQIGPDIHYKVQLA